MKPWIWIVLILVFSGLSCAGGFAIGTVSGAARGIAEAVTKGAEASVSITAPSSVKVGQEFDIVLAVTDTAGRQRTIKNVDLYDDLLEGFTIVSVKPSQVGRKKELGYTSILLNHAVAPSATSSVTVRLKATTEGVFSGDVDTQFERITAMDSQVVTIEVTKAGAAKPASGAPRR